MLHKTKIPEIIYKVQPTSTEATQEEIRVNQNIRNNNNK